MSIETYLTATHSSNSATHILSLPLFYFTLAENSLLKARMRKKVNSSASVFKNLHILIDKMKVFHYDNIIVLINLINGNSPES